MGASIQAGIIAGTDVRAVLVDITPHTLGIKCLDEFGGFDFPFRFAPIIHRNSPLPASRSELFHTCYDQQTEVQIEVYQGESDDVRNNHRIGEFMVQGLARVTACNQIVVQLDLNLDGMLKVSAREKATGLQKQVTIENALARFERDEQTVARERLDRLWESTDDNLETAEPPFGETSEREEEVPTLAPGPREGQRETVQARALLEKAERLLPGVLAEDRPDIEKHMENIRTALTDRRWDKVTAASNELADLLFYLEDA
jgi:molecular chaperone DnaK